MVTQKIKHISDEIKDKIILIRRQIHRNPELGFKEFETSSLVEDHLRRLGIKVTYNIAKTGVIGLLEGNGNAKTVAIRADMDALPIQEMNDHPYCSQNEGIMHACGHDAHVAILMGTAEILSQLRSELDGNIKFIFQPAEEGLGGAKYMVSEGVLDSPKVDWIIATHVHPALDCGKISIGKGTVMASPGEFEIIIKGKGGHAAEPHRAIDPIAIGANLVNLFQNTITRQKNPLEHAVLSVTTFQAGQSYNIIPDTAVLRGTVRTFDYKLSKKISDTMREMTHAVTHSMGADYEFHYDFGYPPVVNDLHVAEKVVGAARKHVPGEHVITNIPPTMLAEDFSYYTDIIPGAIFNLGSGNVSKGISDNLHSCRFNIDEGCIPLGMQILAQTAVDLLQSAP